MFEAIKSFLQQTNMIREARINVPRTLFHIGLFSKMTIEECILDIKLAERPVVGHSKRKDNTNSGSLDDRAKSVSVVKTRYLCIALSNKAGFETLNRSIGEVLGPKHPFGTHNAGVGKSRDQNPGTIILQSLNFFIHDSEPNRIFSSKFEPFWLSGCQESREKTRGSQDSKIRQVASFENTSLGSCEHMMRTRQNGSNRSSRGQLSGHERSWTRIRVLQRRTCKRITSLQRLIHRISAKNTRARSRLSNVRGMGCRGGWGMSV